MSILFSSDYHIGVDRYSHTTAASRRALKMAVAGAAMSAVRFEANQHHFSVCLGDLFDTFSNSEEDILNGHGVLSRLNLCLTGNHDVSNDANKMGSLEMLTDLLDPDYTQVPRMEVSAHGHTFVELDDAVLYSVPHHASQAQFENALEGAMATISETDERPAILLLHCNYNLSAALLNETSLNITEADAEILLEEFDYILLGHEHTPAEYFGGRLLIVGNTFPTSFGDISDKRVITFDGDKMTSHKTWDASTGYVELPVESVLENPTMLHPQSVRFIRITGSVTPNQVHELSRGIKQVWETNPHLLMVGNFTETLRQVSDDAVDFAADDLSLTLPEKIDRALDGSPLQAMWKEIYDMLEDSGEAK